MTAEPEPRLILAHPPSPCRRCGMVAYTDCVNCRRPICPRRIDNHHCGPQRETLTTT